MNCERIEGKFYIGIKKTGLEGFEPPIDGFGDRCSAN